MVGFLLGLPIEVPTENAQLGGFKKSRGAGSTPGTNFGDKGTLHFHGEETMMILIG